MCDLSSACFTNSTGNTSGLCRADWRDLQWVKSPQLHWDMFRSAGSAAGGAYGENCSCLLQTGGLGSAQQMSQGWVAPHKLIFHFMCKAELSSVCPNWGSVPCCCSPSWLVAVLLSLPPTPIPALPQGSPSSSSWGAVQNPAAHN